MVKLASSVRMDKHIMKNKLLKIDPIEIGKFNA
jgi:hypothetical protein